MGKPVARLIQQLQEAVLAQQAAVTRLTAERAALRMRERAAALLCRQCAVLVELSAAAAAARRQRRAAEHGSAVRTAAAAAAAAGGAAAGCSAATELTTADDDGAAGRVGSTASFSSSGGSGSVPPAAASRCGSAGGSGTNGGDDGGGGAQLVALVAQLRAASDDEDGGRGGGGGAQHRAPGATPVDPAAPPLSWSPAAAALRLEDPDAPGALSTDSLRALLRDFATAASCLLPRIRKAAPNAADALAQLSAHLSPVLEFVAALACRGEGNSGGGGGGSGAAGGLTPIMAVVMSPLDGSDAAMPDERQWTWAVEQEELVTALFDLWHARNTALNARRAQLLATVEAHARSEAAAHESVLRALTEAQAEAEVYSIVVVLGLYGNVLSPVQFGTLLVSSWPYVPSLHGLHAVLAARRGAPGGGAGAAAQAGDGAGGSGNGDRGGDGGGSGGPGRRRRGRTSA
ncbi:hypothetical protein Rsub_04741 [Raphidocelis subcapitata]|uniref:Uncharacterized protein n=1 Tax=Raphidocelis subcapitata TaxID=307507 RepID=A0A2V0P496_9CHLO|nr:hypothetical protein Rsub_04741 [Raphidocelis subcapitata]|eukprot:GBF92017.1 hypothetical protein Rsub_04741 [Raphidocelis subcapitata]